MKYPCLKEYTDGDLRGVVLFYSERVGTIIETNNEELWPLGYPVTDWDDTDGFKLFGGTITLRNEG